MDRYKSIHSRRIVMDNVEHGQNKIILSRNETKTKENKRIEPAEISLENCFILVEKWLA